MNVKFILFFRINFPPFKTTMFILLGLNSVFSLAQLYNIGAFWRTQGSAIFQTIYRSVGPANSNVMVCGGTDGSSCQLSIGNLTISGTTATFASALPPFVGVGDVIVYDSNHNGTLGPGDSVAFISGMTSPTVFSVQNTSGGIPTAYAAAKVWRIYRAYTSLQSALTGFHSENPAIVAIDNSLGYFDSAFNASNNLVTRNLQWNIALYGDALDSTPADTTGWKTSSTNYLRIYTPILSSEVGGSQRHGGYWNSYGYTLSTPGGAAFGINVTVSAIRIEGLKIEFNGSSGAAIQFDNSSTGIVGTGNSYLDNNLILVTNNLSGIKVQSGITNLTGNLYVFNNTLVSLSSTAGIGLANLGSYENQIYVYNNTVRGFQWGFQSNSQPNAMILKNNIAVNSNGYQVNAPSTGDYNLSSSVNGTGGAHDVLNTFPQFVDTSTYDYSLSWQDTNARDSGINLSADPNLAFNTDVGQNPRSIGSGWDRGASEAVIQIFRSVGPNNANILACGGGDGSGCGHSGGSLTISANSASFAAGLPNNVGVGDAIVYDCNSNSSLGVGDCIAFIYSRTNSSSFQIRNAAGATPTAFAASTVWRIYRAYTSLPKALAGNGNENPAILAIDSTLGNFDSWTNGRNMVTNHEQWNFSMYGDSPEIEASVTIQAPWVGSATNYLRIYTPVTATEIGISQRHSGVWNPQVYNLTLTSYPGFCVEMNFVKLDGLQIEGVGTTGTSTLWWQPTYGSLDVSLSNSLVWNAITAAGYIGVLDFNEGAGITSGSLYINNNVIYSTTTSDFAGINIFENGLSTTYLYNNTFYTNVDNDCYGGNAITKNNILLGGFGVGGGCNSPGSDYNFSDVVTGTGGTHDQSNIALSPFVNLAGKDFRLLASSSAAGAGINLSMDPFLAFSSDNMGYVRNTAWDIGAISAYGPATQLVFTKQPDSSVASGSEIPVQITIEDAVGRVVAGGPDSNPTMTLTLSSGAGPLNGTTAISAAFGIASYVLSKVNIVTQGAGDILTATKSSTTGSGGVGALTNTSSSFSVISNNLWFGSTPTAYWLTTGKHPAAGQGDGMFNAPVGSFVDGAGNLYVADIRNNRISKFGPGGAYIGWIGWVGVTPTGGAAGCATTTQYNVTPGWCTGGIGQGTDQWRTFSPYGLWGDGTYLYVVSGKAAVMRFNASTGVYMGWVGFYNGGSGGMLDTYTVGCSTLDGSVTPLKTPGWCMGSEGNTFGGAVGGDGAFQEPVGITGDGTYLYILDSNYADIQRIQASTGMMKGWIGQNVNTTACGVAGTFTSGGWCTTLGAYSQNGGAADGSLNPDSGTSAGIYYFGGSLYVGDVFNAKINRYNATTGAFTGWTGVVSTTPTGGDAGCTTTSAWSQTPGWCIGGLAQSGNGNGILRYPNNLSGDGTYIYISDNYYRINRYKMSDGSFQGWIGRIGNIGAGTCGTLGNFTTTWCNDINSMAMAGNGDGAMAASIAGYPWGPGGGDNPLGGVFYASNTLWVTDTGNNRVSSYNATTGAFNGWIGAAANAGVTWLNTGLAAGTNDDISNGWPISGVYSDGTSIYLSDNWRIKKLSSATPTLIGWTGEVLDTPTGGPTSGCTLVTSGGMTPGWCTGGFSWSDGNQSGSGEMPTVGWWQSSVHSDGNYLYATSNSQQVNRFDFNGKFRGWIGDLGWSTPTGGDAGCTTLTLNNFTPGWCLGGSSGSGTAGVTDGALNRPTSVYSDGNYVYVTDIFAGAVNKYSAWNGQFIGWIGNIGTSPTGGVAGCAGASGITPGWCTGGAPTNMWNNNGDAGTGGVQSISGDGTYIYVSPNGSLIKRFNATTGAFAGWIGVVDTSGGTCVAAPGNFTGGWCIGGAARSGGGNDTIGAIDNIGGITLDSNYLYVSNGAGYISKYVLSTGAFVGWKGAISATPTGGDAGCTSAAIGTFTPGWCIGGLVNSINLNLVGGMNGPGQISAGGSFLYIIDQGNFKLLRIGK